MRFTARWAAALGAVAGAAAWSIFVSPIFTGGVDLPLDQRVLYNAGSLVALAVGGAFIGYLIVRFAGRR